MDEEEFLVAVVPTEFVELLGVLMFDDEGEYFHSVEPSIGLEAGVMDDVIFPELFQGGFGELLMPGDVFFWQWCCA